MATNDIGVGMVGYAFMGASHSHAWRNVASFFDVPLHPRRVALCGRNRDAVEKAAARFGWDSSETDWRRLIERDDIGIVDVSTPGSTHAEISIAALEAGKHVLCEKPLANTVEEAEAMAQAAASVAGDGVKAMVAFNYRRVPAIALARAMIAEGRLGDIRHVRAAYLQDWIVDPQFPLVWRLTREEAGSGALGDIGAHIIDLAQFLVGDSILAVGGVTETFVKERPLPEDGSRTGRVTVDDAALFVARFARGAVGTFEATRFATGRKNALRIEINGSKGSVAFDLERLNELEYFDGGVEADLQGWSRILVTEGSHPYLEGWWPPGHIIGWEHTFTHEVRDLLVAIAEGSPATPDFDDGLQVQRVLAAVADSAVSGRWSTL
jgi:predicted dehydrogenase